MHEQRSTSKPDRQTALAVNDNDRLKRRKPLFKVHANIEKAIGALSSADDVPAFSSAQLERLRRTPVSLEIAWGRLEDNDPAELEPTPLSKRGGWHPHIPARQKLWPIEPSRWQPEIWWRPGAKWRPGVDEFPEWWRRHLPWHDEMPRNWWKPKHWDFFWANVKFARNADGQYVIEKLPGFPRIKRQRDESGYPALKSLARSESEAAALIWAMRPGLDPVDYDKGGYDEETDGSWDSEVPNTAMGVVTRPSIKEILEAVADDSEATHGKRDSPGEGDYTYGRATFCIQHDDPLQKDKTKKQQGLLTGWIDNAGKYRRPGEEVRDHIPNGMPMQYRVVAYMQSWAEQRGKKPVTAKPCAELERLYQSECCDRFLAMRGTPFPPSLPLALDRCATSPTMPVHRRQALRDELAALMAVSDVPITKCPAIVARGADFIGRLPKHKPTQTPSPPAGRFDVPDDIDVPSDVAVTIEEMHIRGSTFTSIAEAHGFKGSHPERKGRTLAEAAAKWALETRQAWDYAQEPARERWRERNLAYRAIK